MRVLRNGKINKATTVTFRRSPFVVCYWLSRALVFENYATGKKVAGDPFIVRILHFCSQTRSMGELLENFPGENPVALRGGIRRLLKHSLLEKDTKEKNKEQDRWGNWEAWNPSASFFHFSTKNAKYVSELAEDLSGLKKLVDEEPLPAMTKKYPHKHAIQLMRRPVETEFPRVLGQRRTWREFSGKAVGRECLEQLLWLSFGVQGWVDVPGGGRLALTTSPSGGALHPLEAYVAVRNVTGVGAGIYHYDSANHRLELLRKGLPRPEIERYLAGQKYFTGAAFVIFLTAVFARTQWKYKHPRAYRVVLVEAGHVCQTFCLTATWLGLAPFCTMALAESHIENVLKIDGVRESVVYAMGAGRRPFRGATAERLRRQGIAMA